MTSNTQINRNQFNSTTSSTSSRNNQSNQAQQHNSSSAYSQKLSTNSNFGQSQGKGKEQKQAQSKIEDGGIQFRVLSKSPAKSNSNNRNAHSSNLTSNNSYNPHHYENVYDVMGKPNQAHKISQIVMNDSADIFNDWLDGGGVEPSINESIRQSIQCSFVSSECNETKQKYQQIEQQPSLEAQKALQVMNRMNWITYLKVLFDQLDAFNQNLQKHVETANFLAGLKKIKHILPLQSRVEYSKNSAEVAFSFKEVETIISQMPDYITWDNVIDVFLLSMRNSKPSYENKTTKSINHQLRESSDSSSGGQDKNAYQGQGGAVKQSLTQNREGPSQFRINNIFNSQTIEEEDRQNQKQRSSHNSSGRVFNSITNNSQGSIHNQVGINQMQQTIPHSDKMNRVEDSQIVSEVDYDNEGEAQDSNYKPWNNQYIQVHKSQNISSKNDDEEENDGYPITQIEQDQYIERAQSSQKRHQRGLSSMGGAVQVVQTNSLISNFGGQSQLHQRNLSKPNPVSNNPIQSSLIQNAHLGTQAINTVNSHLAVNYGGSSVENQSKNNRKRNEDFYPSFADSLINYGNGSMVQGISQIHQNQTNSSILAGDYSKQYNESVGQNNVMKSIAESQQFNQKLQAQQFLMIPNQGLTLQKQRSSNEDDEACEIDSDYSRPEDENEDHCDSRAGVNHLDRKILEESVRSSRTATFKNVRRTSTAQNHHPQIQPSNQIGSNFYQQKDTQSYGNQYADQNTVANAMIQAVNVQDSYYSANQGQQNQAQFGQVAKNATWNQEFGGNKVNQTGNFPQKKQIQQAPAQSYYNLNTKNAAPKIGQSTSGSQKADSRQSSNNSRNSRIVNQSQAQSYDYQEGQVEMISNQSFGSSMWRNQETQNNYSSVKVDLVSTFETHHNIQKSTRLSSQNSDQKFQSRQMNLKSQMNNPHYVSSQSQNANQFDQQQPYQINSSQHQQNATMISHSSSQSQRSGNNQLKIKQMQNSLPQSQLSQTSQSQQSSQHVSLVNNQNQVDIDYSNQNLKGFELETARQLIPSNFERQRMAIRSLNLSSNQLVKLPSPLEKSIVYMNFSFNKLKSLNGIETCVNLKFLNVCGNQLSSASNLAFLQSMRELIFSHNMLSQLKDIGQLKNLQLLDLSFNKIAQIEQVTSLQSCKKLNTLSLQGNVIEKSPNYELILKRSLPQVKVQDPDQIKDYSQFSDLEHICFTDPQAEILANANTSQINLQEHLLDGQARQTASSEQDRGSVTHLDAQGNQEGKPRSRTPNRERAKSYLGGGANSIIDGISRSQNMNAHQIDPKMKSIIISPDRKQDIIASQMNQLGRNDKRSSNQSQISMNQKTVSQMQGKSPINQKARLQQNRSQMDNISTFNTEGSIDIAIQSQRGPRNQHQGFQRINKLPTDASQERSVMKENQQHTQALYRNDRSKSRLVGERSTSNISRNDHNKQIHSTSAATSGKNATNQVKQSFQQQNSHRSMNTGANNFAKKVSINSQASSQPITQQGKITPRRTPYNMSQPFSSGLTPRQDKSQHQQKKSFSQINDTQNPNHQLKSENDDIQVATPQKAPPSIPSQNSIGKKYSQVTKILKKDISQLNSARQKILSPTTVSRPSYIVSDKQSQYPQSTKNAGRPITNLKQRLMNGASSITEDSSDLVEASKVNRTTNLAAFQMHNASQMHNMEFPQSTKNVQHTQNSFTNNQHFMQGGRITPTSNQVNSSQNYAMSQSKPMASQLQKFIMGSQRPSTSQQQISVTSSRPSTVQTQLSFHQQQQQMQIPSQKLTNLPPKSYQLKSGNPGDKKSKADMSLSVISSSGQQSITHNHSQIGESCDNQINKSQQIRNQVIQNAMKNSQVDIQIPKTGDQDRFRQNLQSNQSQMNNQNQSQASQINISQSQNPLSMFIMNSSASLSHSQIQMNPQNDQTQNISGITSLNNQSSRLNNLNNFTYENKSTDDSKFHQVFHRETFDQSRHLDTMTPDCNIDCITDRSISPVLEESNNIKKLKVDLTQYMNKL